MLNLPNNCRCSTFNVYPGNWKTTKAKLSLTWYADGRFFDPAYLSTYPKGKPIRLKGGVNRLGTLAERRTALSNLITEMEERLKLGFNPITHRSSPFMPEGSAVQPDTPFIIALRMSLLKYKGVKETLDDMNSTLNRLERSAIALKFDKIHIHDIQTKHIKLCLDHAMETNERFTEKRFNKCKAYLSSLYKYLVEIGAAPGNAPRDVQKLEEEEVVREIMTPEKIALVKEHLWTNNRPFYKFMMIFYFSGGRLKELMSLRGRDVDLIGQTYECIVKKGKKRLVKRTIRNVALPLWIEQMQNCALDHYVFSKDLLPGPAMINSKQVTRRWMTHVKKPLKITEDFYSLKHLSTDATIAALGLKVAAGQAGHMSTAMAEKVYGYNESKRIHEELKKLDIEL